MIRLVAVVALVAAACGTGDTQVDAPPLVTSTTAPVTATTDPTAEAATTQAPTTDAPTTTDPTPTTPLPPVSIEQVDCPVDLRVGSVACGVASVPLDRSRPSAGTTVITIATMAADDEAVATPMAVLHGGPGAASTDFAGWLPRQPFTQVFVDQRGTGFVGPDFDCPEFDRSIPAQLAVDSRTAAEAGDDALAACARRLGDDPLLATADSASHAADVVDVMAALGHDRWIAYGVSYGSTIALELLRREPTGLVGVVLDGVYPPEIDVDAGVAFSATAAVDELDAACAADARCASWTDDVSGLLDTLIERLDATPMRVPVAARDLGTSDDVVVVLDGRRLADLTLTLLYSESRLRYLPGALAGIAEGDTDAAAWLASAGAELLISAWAANDEGTFYSVQCRDRLPFARGPSGDLGLFEAAVTSVLLAEACEPWDREPAPPAVAEPVESDIPTLLLSGRFDPITPPAYAEDVAARLGSATVVEQDGRGHGIWIGNACIEAIVARFVADPGSRPDTSCAAEGPGIDWARP